MKHRVIYSQLVIILIAASYSTMAQSGKQSVRINHTAIFVKDLQTTKTFYEMIIGLDTIPEPFHDGKHAWYSVGPGVSLHVIQGATDKKEY